MPRILAIDWDRNEARALLVQSGPTGTSVAGAWAVPLDSAEGTPASGRGIGERLAAAIADQSLSGATTIVGVGRDYVQMKLLALPPAPLDELPDLVRFQAEREFTNLGDEASLDFIPLAGDAQTPHQVLAVALGPAGMAEAREICQPIGVEPERVVLRAAAPAALVHRAGATSAETVALVVNPLVDEADFTVLVGDAVVLMRTVRLPDTGQGEARLRTLVSEIRRTLAAVRQQLGDHQVGQMLVCAGPAGANQARELDAELGIPVTLFVPADHAPAGLNRHAVEAASLARFAAVLGMATSEADRRAPVIDFLNVRRRVAARRFTRTHAIAAAGAAMIVALIAFNLWYQGAALDRKLADVRQQIQDRQAMVEQAEKVTAEAAAVDAWLATDVTWLDGLDILSQRMRPEPLSAKDFPTSSDVVATQLTMFRPTADDPAAGRIDLQAVAKNPAAIGALERRLRDVQHEVRPGNVKQDSSLSGYPSSFNLDVGVLAKAEEGTP
jgi:Tfp pilus assembly PilM family ATPase